MNDQSDSDARSSEMVGNELGLPLVADGETVRLPGGTGESDVIRLGYNDAFHRLRGSADFVRTHLQIGYAQARSQAQGWFWASLVFASLGFLLIGWGVYLILDKSNEGATLSVVGGAILNAVSALFFVQSRHANSRVDAILGQLSEARTTQELVAIANGVEDAAVRNQMKMDIVRRILRLRQREP